MKRCDVRGEKSSLEAESSDNKPHNLPHNRPLTSAQQMIILDPLMGGGRPLILCVCVHLLLANVRS